MLRFRISMRLPDSNKPTQSHSIRRGGFQFGRFLHSSSLFHPRQGVNYCGPQYHRAWTAFQFSCETPQGSPLRFSSCMLLISLQEDHTRHFLKKCLVPFLFREPWFNLRQSPIFQQELYSNFLWSSAEVFPLKLASIASAHQRRAIDYSTLPNKR